MDVEIQQLRSRVDATDSASLLDPRFVERLVRLVAQRVREMGERDERVRAERRFTSSSAPEERVP
jgi:predicted proteasome-type protease